MKMPTISNIRKEFVHTTLSPRALIFPSANWRFLYDWMKFNEQNNQQKEFSASEDEIWTSVANPSILAYESQNLPHKNGSKCECCPATIYSEIPNFTDPGLPTYEELYPKLYEKFGKSIDIEAGEPMQTNVPKNKFYKLIKKYSNSQENDNLLNCMQILGLVLLFLIIIVTIVIAASFGLYYYSYY